MAGRGEGRWLLGRRRLLRWRRQWRWGWGWGWRQEGGTGRVGCPRQPVAVVVQAGGAGGGSFVAALPTDGDHSLQQPEARGPEVRVQW